MVESLLTLHDVAGLAEWERANGSVRGVLEDWLAELSEKHTSADLPLASAKLTFGKYLISQGEIEAAEPLVLSAYRDVPRDEEGSLAVAGHVHRAIGALAEIDAASERWLAADKRLETIVNSRTQRWGRDDPRTAAAVVNHKAASEALRVFQQRQQSQRDAARSPEK